MRGFSLLDQAPARAGSAPAHATLRKLRQLGMRHIRLPVAAEAVLADYAGPAAMSRALDDMSRMAESLFEIGYHVSVDLHPQGEFPAVLRTDPERAKKSLLQGWPSLAKRLSRWPAESCSAELLNEPGTTDDIWRPFVETLAQAVRAELPRHTIIVGPAPFQRLDALVNWTPLSDSNVVYACHYYDPMPFTHQGAVWDVGSPWANAAGVPFPTGPDDPKLFRLAESQSDSRTAAELRKMATRAWNAGMIAQDFQRAAAWGEKHQAPIVVNEFGVLKWKAPRADRLAWLAAVRKAAESCGFGWTHWEYATSFGLLKDDGRLDEGVIHALLAA